MMNNLFDSDEPRETVWSANLRYLPIGDVLLFLDAQIARCEASRDLAFDEQMEEFYIEASAAYRWFKVRFGEFVQTLEK